MIRHYLIPPQIVPDFPSSHLVREPKYLTSLKVNWVGEYIESKDMYLVKVNNPNAATFTSIESNPDVVFLDDNTKAIKDKVSSKLGIPKMKDTDDVIDVVGKLQEPSFKKTDLFISD